MSTSKWIGALFLAAGMALPGAVHAVSARASVTGFGIQLIDLNPTDGIAPALQFELTPDTAAIFSADLAISTDGEYGPLPGPCWLRGWALLAPRSAGEGAHHDLRIIKHRI